MVNSRSLGTRIRIAPLMQLAQPLAGGYNAHPLRRSYRHGREEQPPRVVRPAGTWEICGSTVPPTPFARHCFTYKDTKAMTIQRFTTADFVDNYQPLPRHKPLNSAYFKTHYRANRKSDLINFNPTNYHLLCIIEPFLGIPSYRFYIRHNIQPAQQSNLNLLHDTIYGVGIMDRWDTCDMIQSLMITNDLLCSIILIKYKYLYGNKKKKSRHNLKLGKQRLLIRTDNK